MDEDAPTQTDLELALDIACNDHDAICAFIAQHGPKIRGFLHKRYPTVWEDAWQDAIIRLVGKINQFDPEKGSLRSWSIKLAQNCALSILRAEQKHLCAEAHEDIDNDKRRPPREPPTPKQRRQIEHRDQQIREAVGELPPREQEVTLADLAHPDGTAPAGELAAAFGMTENAVHQARFRARKKLREKFERRGLYREDTRP